MPYAHTHNSTTYRPPARLAAAQIAVFALAAGVTVASAIVIKEFVSRGGQPSLTAVEAQNPTGEYPVMSEEQIESLAADVQGESPLEGVTDPTAEEDVPESMRGHLDLGPAGGIDENALPGIADTQLRFFNGRPVRPARVMTMVVTGYSPDERSCGDSADGITASLHRVETNGFKMVAADTRVLPLGSMVTIPGYDTGNIVPVLDRGGAIKGRRLDLLFPTHEQARKWGVRKIAVTVWEYADGRGSTDWRRARDGK